MESMVRGIDAPPVPMSAVRDRIAAPLGPQVRPHIPFLRYALAAAAAIALFFAIFPKASLAVIDRFERIVVNSYAAAYRVMGWTPPPEPPKALETGAAAQRVSLKEAQAKVAFTIVAPVGLPSGSTLAAIQTLRVLVYDKTTRKWSKASPAIEFDYDRPGKRQFALMAVKDDPRTGPPSKYVYEALDLPGGRVELIKHAHFDWRNGDQVMAATEDDGITSAEIQAIRAAMHGEAVIHSAHTTVEKQYLLP
jgi:hypothetical protein